MDFTLNNAIFIAGAILVAGLLYIITKKLDLWDDIADALGHAWVAFLIGGALIYISTNNLFCPVQYQCAPNPCGSGFSPGELACQANYQLTIASCNAQMGAQITWCNGFNMAVMGIGFLLVIIGGVKVGWNIIT